MRAIICLVLTIAPLGAIAQSYDLNTIVSVRIYGAGDRDNVGINFDGAGDLNGDGYEDLIIGTEETSGPIGTIFENFAYIVLGSTDIPLLIDLGDPSVMRTTISGFINRAEVAGIGDFNGDGYDDAILGDPGASSEGVGEGGRAFIFFGGQMLPDSFAIGEPDIPGISIAGARRRGYLGFALSDGGDINGDGLADVLMSAPGQNSMDDTGEVFIVMGSTDFPDSINTSDLQGHGVHIQGAVSGDGFGYNVNWLGDINGDGYDDIIIGVEGRALNPSAYVIFGGTDLPSQINVSTMGSLGLHINGSSQGLFGRVVSGAGDVNGDGLCDFLVSASSSVVNGFSGAGKIFMFFGRSSFPRYIEYPYFDRYSLIITGNRVGGGLGESIAGAGYVGEDNLSDMLLGTPSGTMDTNILFGAEDYSQMTEVQITQLSNISIVDTNAGLLGKGLSFVGDINGDGYEDIGIGDPLANLPGRYDIGVIYIIFGNAFLQVTETPTPAITPTPSQTATQRTPTPNGNNNFCGWILSGNGGISVTTDIDQ